MVTPIEELLTRWTVRLAVAAYAWVFLSTLTHNTNSTRKTDRILWTIGCGLFLWHVVCAFAFYHQWSHTAAYKHTAMQTADLIGWHWGGGLYLNYAFTLIWVADVVWWWSSPAQREQHPLSTIALHSFFLFMIFNATVVFGPRLWIPVTIVYSVLCVIARRRASSLQQQS